jgi:hypothetical protein
MKSQAKFSALFIAAFLCFSFGSVMYVESTAAGPSVPCAVNWNNKKNQVKDKHRRKYIGCLIEALKPEGVNQIYLPRLIDDMSEGCISDIDVIERNLVGYGGEFVQDYVKDKKRRSTIACLEGKLK